MTQTAKRQFNRSGVDLANLHPCLVRIFMGWFVHEFDAKTVFAEAANVLGLDDISVRMKEIGEPFGPPWNKDHKLATAAAVVAARSLKTSNVFNEIVAPPAGLEPATR